MIGKPPTLFPDVEAWAITYLTPKLGGTRVSNATPSTMPASLVTVRDDGGSRGDDVTKTVSVGVNVWAESAEACSDLARLVAAHLEAAPGDGPVVAHVATSGPYPVVEASTKPHRYLSVDLLVAGSPL